MQKLAPTQKLASMLPKVSSLRARFLKCTNIVALARESSQIKDIFDDDGENFLSEVYSVRNWVFIVHLKTSSDTIVCQFEASLHDTQILCRPTENSCFV
jgi:hypothetical protein